MLLFYTGIANPPGGRDPNTGIATPKLIVDELPWPNQEAVTSTYFEWLAPAYTGNLSSLSYRFRYNRDHFLTDHTSTIVELTDFSLYLVRVGVYDEAYNIVSDETTIYFEVDSTCRYEGESHSAF